MARAPPHHEIAFGGVGVGFLCVGGWYGGEVGKAALPWVLTCPFLQGLLRKQGLALSITGGRTVAAIQGTRQG